MYHLNFVSKVVIHCTFSIVYCSSKIVKNVKIAKGFQIFFPLCEKEK
jgi:hypothetical protein